MKVFAFLLATLFVFQAGTPALCMTNCAADTQYDSSCCVAEKSDECCMIKQAECGSIEQQSCCASEEISACQGFTEDGNASSDKASIPCNSCNIPCCSAPLCCFYFQEISDLDLSVCPVTVTGALPSNNGVPFQGCPDECFQPPELIG